MDYSKITNAHIEKLQLIVGKEQVFFDQENLVKYGKDETEDLMFQPEVVVKPRTPEEISE